MTATKEDLYKAQVKNLEEARQKAKHGIPMKADSPENTETKAKTISLFKDALIGKKVQSLSLYKDCIIKGDVAHIDSNAEPPVLCIRLDDLTYIRNKDKIDVCKVLVVNGNDFIDNFELL